MKLNIPECNLNGLHFLILMRRWKAASIKYSKNKHYFKQLCLSLSFKSVTYIPSWNITSIEVVEAENAIRFPTEVVHIEEGEISETTSSNINGLPGERNFI